jgi:amino acid transporter
VSNLSLSQPVFLWCRLERNFRSFGGYSNTNYVLSEIRDPVRTIKRANPIAIAFITITYMLANIAYFGAVSKNDILGSGRIVG